jgi:hypothetical protein
VRFTWRTWNLTTHRIDPDVDEARDYVMEDLSKRDESLREGMSKVSEHVQKSLLVTTSPETAEARTVTLAKCGPEDNNNIAF